jgi:hypothetical protein
MAKPVPRTPRPPALRFSMMGGGILPSGAHVVRFEDGSGVVQNRQGETVATWGQGELMHDVAPAEFTGPTTTPFGGTPLIPLPARLSRRPLPVAPDSGYRGASITGTPNRYLPAIPPIYGTRIA